LPQERERNNSADTKVNEEEGVGGGEKMPEVSEQSTFPCNS